MKTPITFYVLVYKGITKGITDSGFPSSDYPAKSTTRKRAEKYLAEVPSQFRDSYKVAEFTEVVEDSHYEHASRLWGSMGPWSSSIPSHYATSFCKFCNQTPCLCYRVAPPPSKIMELREYILKTLRSDLSHAQDSVAHAEREQARMPMNHDNNDALICYRKWVERAEMAVKLYMGKEGNHE